MKVQYIGTWIGSCDTNLSFDHFTVFQIKKEAKFYGIRRDKKLAAYKQSELHWTGQTSFECTGENWILGTPLLIVGCFKDGKLHLLIGGDGMTGLESYSVILTKSELQSGQDDIPTKHEVPIKDTSSPRHGTTIDTKVLEWFIAELRQLKGTEFEPNIPRFDAVGVHKDGRMVLEEYSSLMDNDKLHLISSCTKSIMSILICIAIDQGVMTLEDDVANRLGIKSEWSKEAPILLKHILSMSAGTDFKPEDSISLLLSTDVVNLTFSENRLSTPGSVYNYDNNLPALLACYLEFCTGVSVEKFAEKHLFTPLGIIDYQWTYMRQQSDMGTPLVLGSGGLRMTMTDFMKIGLMMLHKGAYNGQQIVSSTMVDISTSQFTPTPGYSYGFYWHLNNPQEGCYCALGQGGQLLCIVPAKLLVVCVLSSTWHSVNPVDDIVKHFINLM